MKRIDDYSEKRVDEARIKYETLVSQGEAPDSAFWLTVGSSQMTEDETDTFEKWFTHREEQRKMDAVSWK